MVGRILMGPQYYRRGAACRCARSERASWMAHRTVGAKLFGSCTPVRVVLHGLRRSRLVVRRLGGQATCSWGICHLLRKYTAARPVRMQRRPVSRPGQQGLVLDDDLVEQNLHSTFEIVLRLENGFGRIVRLECTIHFPIEIAAVTRLVCVRKLQQSLTARQLSLLPALTVPGLHRNTQCFVMELVQLVPQAGQFQGSCRAAAPAVGPTTGTPERSERK